MLIRGVAIKFRARRFVPNTFCIGWQLWIYQLPTVRYQLPNSEKAFQNGGSERKKTAAGQENAQ